MRYRRLRKLQHLAQAGHVSLAFAQKEQDIEPGFVRKEPEQARELFQILVRCPDGFFSGLHVCNSNPWCPDALRKFGTIWALLQMVKRIYVITCTNKTFARR